MSSSTSISMPCERKYRTRFTSAVRGCSNSPIYSRLLCLVPPAIDGLAPTKRAQITRGRARFFFNSMRGSLTGHVSSCLALSCSHCEPPKPYPNTRNNQKSTERDWNQFCEPSIQRLMQARGREGVTRTCGERP